MPRKKKVGKRAYGEGGVRQRSDGRWEASLRHHGRRYVRYGATQADALKALDDMRASLRDGLPLNAEKLTVGAWVEYWLEHLVREHLEPTTYDGYGYSVRLHIAPEKGPSLRQVPLRELQVDDVERWLRDMKTAGKGLRTRQFALARLRTAINEAIRRPTLGIRWNAAQLARMPTAKGEKLAPKKQASAASVADAQRLLAAAAGDPDESLVTIALMLGLRRSEALGLMWDDVDLVNKRLTVRRRVTRTTRDGLAAREGAKSDAGERTIPLPDVTIAAFDRQWQRQLEDRLRAGTRRWKGPSYSAGRREGFIFTSGVGTLLEPRNVYRSFARMRAKAGLNEHTFHGLRHDCASLLLAQGVPLWVVSKILGHSSVKVTADIYGHLLDEGRIDAMGHMDRIFGAAGAVV